MKQIDVQRLASRMRVIQSRFPQVCRKNFVAELKGILNQPEAERFFKHFCETQKLVPSQRRFHFSWTVRQDFFEPDTMKKIIDNNLISSYQFRSKQQRKSWKTRKSVELPEIDGAKMVENIVKALSSFSDEELSNELSRRKEIHDRQAKLQLILETAEISLEELKTLIATV